MRITSLKLQNLKIFRKYILTPGLTASEDLNAKTGDVYIVSSTSGGETEVFDSKIIIIPSNKLIRSCVLNIFQGNINVTYDGRIWRWDRRGDNAQGEIKLYKLDIIL